jgi:hypothetical protein
MNITLEFILSVINVLGLIFVLKEGTFINTKYFKYSSFFISTYIIGIFLKITHWGFGNELLAISSIFILLLYVKHFTKKLVKQKIDYLKLLWVFTTLLIIINTIFHLYSRDLKIIPMIIMFFILLEYFRNERSSSKNI